MQIKGVPGSGIALEGGTVNLSNVVITDSYDIDVAGGTRAISSTSSRRSPTTRSTRTTEPVNRSSAITKVGRKTGSLYRMSLCWVVRTPIGQMRTAMRLRGRLISKWGLQQSSIDRRFQALTRGVSRLVTTQILSQMLRSNMSTEIVSTGSTPDWSRVADTEIGIQTGPFPITSSLAADVGYTVEFGAGAPIDNGSGFILSLPTLLVLYRRTTLCP